jgi:hypothetical protein
MSSNTKNLGVGISVYTLSEQTSPNVEVQMCKGVKGYRLTNSKQKAKRKEKETIGKATGVN